MKRLVLALAVLLAVTGFTPAAGGQSAPADSSPTAAPCAGTPWATYKRAVHRTWRYSVTGVGDYHAGPKPSSRAQRRLGRMRRCVSHRKRERMLVHVRQQRQQWRFHRYIDRITPYGEWAIPSPIVMCESHGNYREWNHGGSGASGAYQAMQRTWLAYGGGRWAAHAAYAPPFAQHIVAGRIWRGQGRGAWSC